MNVIKTGIKPLDDLIGGWGRGVMTLLVGETGVGKSTLLISSALKAVENGVKVFYLDVEGNIAGDKVPGGLTVELANVSMEELEEAVSKLSKLPQSAIKDSLIIVDSVTYHYHALIRMAREEKDRDRLQAALENVVYRLHGITVRNNTATILSTWPTSMLEEESDFIGGFAVKTYTRIQLRMEFTELDRVRRIRVIKHPDISKYGSSALIRLEDLAQAVFKPAGEVVEREPEAVG